MLNVLALTGAKTAPFHEAGHRIEFVRCGGLYAAVEQVQERPPVSEAALRTQHAIVSRIASRIESVLPARFGSVIDREELTRIVQLRHQAIQEALALVRGREQMTVRLFSPDARSPGEASLASAPTGTAYLEARRSAAVPPMPDAVAIVSHAVRGVVAAERAEAGRGRVAATLYHLLDRGAVASYEAALADAKERLDPDAMTVSGPWPPFAFAPELW